MMIILPYSSIPPGDTEQAKVAEVRLDRIDRKDMVDI